LRRFEPETSFWPARKKTGKTWRETKADSACKHKGEEEEGGEGGNLRALELESRGQEVVVNGEQLGVKVEVFDLTQ
jgi:hypothetical protein